MICPKCNWCFDETPTESFAERVLRRLKTEMEIDMTLKSELIASKHSTRGWCVRIDQLEREERER